MSTTFLFKIYNATVCEITMQASSDSVDSKLLKPSTLCQYWVIKWGSIFNTEIYRENVKQSSFQELLCYSLRDYYASILRNLGTYDNFSKFYDNLEEFYMYKFWKRYEQCFWLSDVAQGPFVLVWTYFIVMMVYAIWSGTSSVNSKLTTPSPIFFWWA